MWELHVAAYVVRGVPRPCGRRRGRRSRTASSRAEKQNTKQPGGGAEHQAAGRGRAAASGGAVDGGAAAPGRRAGEVDQREARAAHRHLGARLPAGSREDPREKTAVVKSGPAKGDGGAPRKAEAEHAYGAFTVAAERACQGRHSLPIGDSQD